MNIDDKKNESNDAMLSEKHQLEKTEQPISIALKQQNLNCKIFVAIYAKKTHFFSYQVT